MYKISTLSATKQGDERFQLELEDGGLHEFHIWDYAFLYRYPNLYQQLIVELLDCKIYQVMENQLSRFIVPSTPLKIVDVACGSGLMGKYLHQHSSLSVHYLAGIDVIPDALTALKRDTPNIYNDCYLASHNHQVLKQQNLNCMIICGAANHIQLSDFKYYTSLLVNNAYLVFNLIEGKQPDIINWLNSQYKLLNSEAYTHRKLMNGTEVKHHAFIYKVNH